MPHFSGLGSQNSVHLPRRRQMNLLERLKATEQRCQINTRYRRPSSAAPTLPRHPRGPSPGAARALPAVTGRGGGGEGRRARSAHRPPGTAAPTPALTSRLPPPPRGGGSRLTDPGGHIDEVEAGGREGEEEDEGEHGAIGDPQHLPEQWHPPPPRRRPAAPLRSIPASRGGASQRKAARSSHGSGSEKVTRGLRSPPSLPPSVPPSPREPAGQWRPAGAATLCGRPGCPPLRGRPEGARPPSRCASGRAEPAAAARRWQPERGGSPPPHPPTP